MYDKSLRTDDITGAQPKGKGFYKQQQQQSVQNQIYNYQQLNQQQNIFQQYDPSYSQLSNIPQNQNRQMNLSNAQKQQQGGRKLFTLPQTEIAQNQIFSQPKDQLEEYAQNQQINSRSLQTNDIQGTKPGSLASAAVKNQQKAQQISQQNQIQEQQYRAYEQYQQQQEDNYSLGYQQQQCSQQQQQQQYQQQYPSQIQDTSEYNQNYNQGLESLQQNNQQQYSQNSDQQKIEEEKRFLQNLENYYRGMTPSIDSRKQYTKIQDNLIRIREEKLKKVDEQIKHDEKIYSSDQFINDIATFYDGEKLIKQKQQEEIQEQKHYQLNEQQPQNNQQKIIEQNPSYKFQQQQQFPNNKQAELDELQQKIKLLEQQLSTNKNQIQAQPSMQRYNPTSLSFAGKNDLIQNNIQATTGNQILNDKYYSQPQAPSQAGNQKNIHRFGGGLKNMGFM